MNNENLEQLSRIYDRLQDDLSRQLFKARLLYSITGEAAHIYELFRTPYMQTDHSLMKYLDDPDIKIICFGASYGGSGNLGDLNKLTGRQLFMAFCDNDPEKWEKKLCGLDIISPSRLASEYADTCVYISTDQYRDEIRNQLINMGWPEDRIMINPWNFQYFEDFWEPHSDEVFIDGGSFNGATSLQFSRFCKGSYKHIYSFEPDKRYVATCMNNFQNWGLHDISFYNNGLYSSEKKVHLHIADNGASFLEGNGSESISTKMIDKVLNGEPATFIKMDIEGSELEALKGAEFTIRTYKPRLAISLYHKKEDILEIPLYLLNLYPGYKFYLRHYSYGTAETVLYAY